MGITATFDGSAQNHGKRKGKGFSGALSNALFKGHEIAMDAIHSLLTGGNEMTRVQLLAVKNKAPDKQPTMPGAAYALTTPEALATQADALKGKGKSQFQAASSGRVPNTMSKERAKQLKKRATLELKQ